MKAGCLCWRIAVVTSVFVVLCAPLAGAQTQGAGRVPRGYMTSLQELSRIKAQADKKVEPYASAVAAATAFADGHLGTAHAYVVPESYDFDHKDLELPTWMCEMSRAAYGLVLAYRLTGNDAYAKKTREYLLAVQRCKNLDATYQRWAMVNVSVHVPKFVHAADLLEGWDGWSVDDRRALQEWACQVAYPVCRRSLKQNVGGNHVWADAACMTFADYCWDRPELRFRSEDPADLEIFDTAEAYAHARQEFFNQANGNNEAAVSYNADNFVFGQEGIMRKAMIRPDGGVPDGLLFSEKSDSTVIRNVTNGSNYTVVWLMSTMEAYLYACELAYRRGDPGLYAHIATTADQQYVVETGAVVTLPPGRGSVREMFLFLLMNEERGGAALDFNDYHRGVFEVFLRRYKDWALPVFVDWRIVDGQFVGGRFEIRQLAKANVDRLDAFLQKVRPIADAWIPFATLTHADPLGVVGEPPTVPPPGGEAGAPIAPKWLTVTPHSGVVCLAWQAPPRATSYLVKRSTKSGTGYETIAAKLTSSKYTDTKVANGTTYYYVVVPMKGDAEGKASGEAAVTPKFEPPLPPIVGSTMIPAGSSWKYIADGKEPDPGWRGKTFSETRWLSGKGPLGFGVPTAATPVAAGRQTYYFRKIFAINTEPTKFPRHSLSVTYTGGFVLYLNGQEVLRRAMPDGPVSYKTPATGTSGVTSEVIDLTRQINPLIPRLPHAGGRSAPERGHRQEFHLGGQAGQ